jgi:hypothetical protein
MNLYEQKQGIEKKGAGLIRIGFEEEMGFDLGFKGRK